MSASEHRMSSHATDVVDDFWQRMRSNDFRWAAALLADDFVLEWPQSGERIRGRANFAAMNADYPSHGRWQFHVHRVVGNAEEAVSDVEVTDGMQRARAISFFTVRDGQIAAMTEFWPEPYDPPASRSHLVERMTE